jgi:glycosyltransferase involved in cell wall biosynthesis
MKRTPPYWPIAEQKVRVWESLPILSIVIPTFDRSDKLTLCVESIAGQIVGDLIGKIEIIISDNDSPKDAQENIRSLYALYPFISYYIHEKNGGGIVQFNTAPWRAQGEWVWLFGDDDLLLDGGIELILNRLNRDQPDFLTLNRCVVNDDLSSIINPAKHNIPSLNFPTFIDLLKLMGIDQLSFFTSQIYRVKLARDIATEIYMNSEAAYAQVAYYLDGYAFRPSAYESEVFVIHRWQPNDVGKHHYNFYHLAVTLPEILARVRDRLGLGIDLFEEIGGAKNLAELVTPELKFVDNIIEYLWWCVASNVFISDHDWCFLLKESRHWRAEGAGKLEQIQKFQTQLLEIRSKYELATVALSRAQKRKLGPMSENKILKLESEVNLLAESWNLKAIEAMNHSKAIS